MSALCPVLLQYLMWCCLHCSEVARRKWGPDIPIVSQLIDTESDETRQESILIGIIYKEMELKPSVLDEFKDANGIAITVAPVATNFCSEVSFFTPLYDIMQYI